MSVPAENMLCKQSSNPGLSQPLNSLYNYHTKNRARINPKSQENFSFFKSIFQFRVINLLKSWRNVRTNQLGQDERIHEVIIWKI